MTTPPPPPLSPPPVPSGLPQKPKTSALAIWSLSLGILSLFTIGITSIPALICGIIALVNIGNAKGAFSGQGLAIGGLVTGGISFVMVPILAALAIPAFQRAKEQAGIVQTMSTARQLELALVMYQTEYGNFPVTAPAGDNDFTGEISGDVLSILSGKAGPLNPREIVFIEARQAEMDRWGHPFHFAVDLNGDGELTIPDPDGSNPKVFRRQVVVWSLGPDGQPGGKGHRQADIFSTAPAD